MVLFESSKLLALLALLLALVNSSLTDEVYPRLPSIWSDGQDGSGKNEPAYRIRAELQLMNSGKSFIFEEWASAELNQFRLDIIENVKGRRSTYLRYKDTNESFYYEPFQCKLVDNFQSVLDKDFADKLQPLNNSQELVPIGIGAMWLHGLKSESIYGDSAGEENNSLSSRLDSYTVFSTEDYPYDLTFYFRANRTNQESLALILVRQLSASKTADTLMRIKILELEISLREALRESPDLFDLPLGYGCKRSDRIDTTFDPAIDAIGVSFGPHIINLDIVAQLPTSNNSIDGQETLHKWRSHSASLKLISGRLTLDSDKHRDYLIIERRDLVPDKRLSGRRATLRELRQVWDLGSFGLTNEFSATTKSASRAIYFELDDSRGECLRFGESQMGAGAGIEFSFFETGNSSTAETSTIKGFTLDTSLIRTVFGSPIGYHQISDSFSKSKKAGFRQLVYERRIEALEMHNLMGEALWATGPASIVRTHLIPPENGRQKSAGPWDQALPEASATIHFLSPLSDQLVGKVHLTLNERRTINHATFHEQLNVKSCFSSSSFDSNNRRELQQTIKLNYPLENDSLADRLDSCGHCRSMVKEQLLRALYNVSLGRLDPLQVDQIKLEVVNSNLLQVSARILRRPNILNYRREGNLKFSSAHQSLLMSEIQANEVACSESCAHYNCLAFTYCSNTSQCDLFMGTIQLLNSMTAEPAKHCALYHSKNRSQNNNSIQDTPSNLRALEPVELIQLIREAVVKTSDNYNPLGLWIYYCEHSEHSHNEHKVDQLVPTSIEVNDDDDDDKRQKKEFRSEYELVLEDRKFKLDNFRSAPIPTQANYMNYDDCRLLCDQMDCKSFSHCQLERTCSLSQLHDTEVIKEHSERADYCFIFAREWLSKFSKPIQVAPPAAAAKATKELKGIEETRDCARRCMEERDFKCKSFVHCPSWSSESLNTVAAVGANCYLSKRHSTYTSTSTSTSKAAAAAFDFATSEIQGFQTSTVQSCQLYTRSYLAEYDRYYGKSLPLVESSPPEVLPSVDGDSEKVVVEIVKCGLSAEACGSECAEQVGVGGGRRSCQAFHVCHTKIPGTRLQESICVLLLLQQQRGRLASQTNETVLRWFKPEELIVNENCTSFIVSPQSELRSRIVESFEELDSEQSLNGPEANNQNQVLNQAAEDDGQFPAEVILLLIGLILGVCLTLVWKGQNY